MIQARYIHYPLYFHRPAGTSRGVLDRKECWFLVLAGGGGETGIGEVSFVPGLSAVEPEDLVIHLDHICRLINRGEMDPLQSLPTRPCIQFALETAVRDMGLGGTRILYPSAFTEGRSGIRVNGLIWMGEKAFMLEQIREKLEMGFRVLKMKVGAIGFSEEVEMLSRIRSEYGPGDLEIRLDANGAWSADEAPGKLEALSALGIHSVEQPVAAGQPEAMAELCMEPAVPVALDEELIGVTYPGKRQELLRMIRPQYIVLKPGLLGGLREAEQWIRAAGEMGIGWWITSALESNIGLNAIAQWTGQLEVTLPQGLGTGQLYRNNIPSPLKMEGDALWYRNEKRWDLSPVKL